MPPQGPFLRLHFAGSVLALSVADGGPKVQPETEHAGHGLVDVLVAIHQGVAKVTHHGDGKLTARQSERGKKARAEGRQRKRQEDNIREWTGLEFSNSQREVENREKWRKLVAKSSTVPQRPSPLRN